MELQGGRQGGSTQVPSRSELGSVAGVLLARAALGAKEDPLMRRPLKLAKKEALQVL